MGPLCENCRKFDLQDFQRHPDGCIALSLEDVRAKSQAGCEMCSLLLETAKDRLESYPWGSWIRISLDGEQESFPGKTVGCTRLNLTINESRFPSDRAFGQKPDPKPIPDEICLVADQASPAFCSKVVKGRYLGEDRTAPEYIAGIQQWLDTCTAEHDLTCNVTLSGTTIIDSHNVPLPRRCIDVGGPKGVVLRDCMDMRGCYVALSHRWTEETNNCKTTQANYGARTRGRGFSGLSKNLQDIMEFVKNLGLRYIWIDSLCIIQDDEADVRQELLKMAQYYQTARCTFAIECPSGTGLLRQQGGRPFEKLVRLPYREAGEQKGYFFVYRRAVREDVEFMTEVNQCELLRRGWVCQEFFLSRRIIHIAPTGTYLQCRSQEPLSMSNQTISMILNWDFTQTPGLRHRPQLRHAFKADFRGSPSFRLWYELTAMYSQMLLTEASDHLKAIAGIASEFALLASSAAPSQAAPSQLETCRTESSPTETYSTESCPTEPSHTEISQTDAGGIPAQYASGLWLHDIHHGLLWQCLSQGPKICDCGAPSWSWLSFAGAIGWSSRVALGDISCEVSSVSREKQSDPNLYFITQSSALVLKGKIQPVLVHGYMSDDIYSEVIRMTARNPKSLSFDGLQYYHAQHSVLISPCSHPDTAAGWGIFERPDLLTPVRDEEPGSYMTLAFCVALHGRSRYHSADVLFLEPVMEGENRFRRVGVGCVADPDISEYFRSAENIEITLV